MVLICFFHWNPLHHASVNGYLGIVETLVQYGANYS